MCEGIAHEVAAIIEDGVTVPSTNLELWSFSDATKGLG